MEISLRKILLALLLVALLLVTGKIVYERVTKSAVTGEPPPGPNITFSDESTAWDWQPEACTGPLATFVKDAATMRVVLIDADTELPQASISTHSGMGR